MEDNQILSALFDRNEIVLKEISAKYARLYRSILWEILDNHQDVEECANDTLLAVWNSIPPNKPQNFPAYICTIARRIGIDRLRYQTRKKRGAVYAAALEELESEYTEPPVNTEGPPVTPPTPPTTPPNTGDDYYEYPIDLDTQFHLTQVIFFRIQLSGDGFLAQTLGTGIVDVVITDFDIFGDYMITFKNGDKYLSCLTNGYGPSEFEFSTHKYIEGFSIIKNGRQINYRFLVTLDGNIQVDHFECDYWDYFNPGNPDGIMPVVGETYIANTDLTFTIDELETYFRSFKAPTQSE